MELKNVTSGNALSLIKDMQERLHSIETAKKKLELFNHALKIDVSALAQRALKLEQEFCYRYKTGTTGNSRVRRASTRMSRTLSSGSDIAGLRVGGSDRKDVTASLVGGVVPDNYIYLHGLVRFWNTRHWKPRYFILRLKALEIHKTPSLPRDGAKPNEVYDLTAASISPLCDRPGWSRPCIQVKSGKKTASFYCEAPNDNLAWYSGICNRRVQASYESQCAQLNEAPSQNILSFLGAWSFAAGPVKLELDKENVDVMAAAVISKCLSDPSRPSSPIEVLRLTNCGLNGAKLADIANGLCTNDTVKTLDLSGNTFTLAMAESLAKGVVMNGRNKGALRELILNDVSFDEESKSTALLLEQGVLAKGSLVKKLSMRSCTLRDDFMSMFARLLRGAAVTTSLAHVDFGDNAIGDQGARALAEVLSTNATVARIDISKNRIRDGGGAALGRALRENDNVREFEFGGNPIGAEAISEFTVTAKVNTRLSALSYAEHRLGRQHMSVMHLLHRYGVAGASGTAGAISARNVPPPGPPPPPRGRGDSVAMPPPPAPPQDEESDDDAPAPPPPM